MRTARRLSALCTLVLALVLLALGPSDVALADGWFTPIIALELATSPAQLTFLTPPVREAIEAMQRVDVAFPFAYGALLVTTALDHRHRSGWRATASLVAAGLGALAIPLDMAENLVIDGILTAVASGGATAEALTWLPLTTWLKWLAISASLCVLATVLGGWVRIPSALPLPLTVAAMVTGLPLLGEGMALVVTAAFLVLIGLAWWGVWRTRAAATPAPPSA